MAVAIITPKAAGVVVTTISVRITGGCKGGTTTTVRAAAKEVLAHLKEATTVVRGLMTISKAAPAVLVLIKALITIASRIGIVITTDTDKESRGVTIKGLDETEVSSVIQVAAVVVAISISPFEAGKAPLRLREIASATAVAPLAGLAGGYL